MPSSYPTESEEIGVFTTNSGLLLFGRLFPGGVNSQVLPSCPKPLEMWGDVRGVCVQELSAGDFQGGQVGRGGMVGTNSV